MGSDADSSWTVSELTGIIKHPAGAWRAGELVGVGKAPFPSFGVGLFSV